MNFAVVIAVFPIIFLGELPDKTMFASLVLATRGKPFSVWLGAAGAFVVHVAIAVTIGVALFRILPHRAVDAVVAAMFLVGAALALREATQDHEEEIVEREVATKRRVVSTAFIVIFLAEWGDLTQILTANLAAHYHAPLSVAVGAVLALWAVAALAVVGGQSLLRFINIRTLRLVTAVILVGLGRIRRLGGLPLRQASRASGSGQVRSGQCSRDHRAHLVDFKEEAVVARLGLNDLHGPTTRNVTRQLLLLRQRVETVRHDAGHRHLGADACPSARAIPPRPRPTSWWFMASLRTT